MSNNTPVQDEKQTLPTQDALTTVLRAGARQLIAQAVEAELHEMLEAFTDISTISGLRVIARNGYLPEREILTGIGPVTVQVPKVRDRSKNGIKFTSQLIPPYLRRAASVDQLLPLLYLKGISSGDMQEALSALVGNEARGLSSSVVSRLKTVWQEEHNAWSKRDLTGKQYVYMWVDGIYFHVRNDADRQCIRVIIGATATGEKEFVAIEDGYRESEQSWSEVLTDLRNRGLSIDPSLAIGDGALGFWTAVSKVFPRTQHQRCWVHKTANVLGKMPKSIQGKAKSHLQEIWMAETRDDAQKSFETFLNLYKAKYPKATECLRKDRDTLLAFYDFPAVHWQHLRTTNPIESTFATIRLRTVKSRNCVSRASILAMVYKLGESAQKRWHRLRGYALLEDVTRGVRYIDGIRADDTQEDQQQSENDRIAA